MFETLLPDSRAGICGYCVQGVLLPCGHAPRRPRRAGRPVEYFRSFLIYVRSWLVALPSQSSERGASLCRRKVAPSVRYTVGLPRGSGSRPRLAPRPRSLARPSGGSGRSRSDAFGRSEQTPDDRIHVRSRPALALTALRRTGLGELAPGLHAVDVLDDLPLMAVPSRCNGADRRGLGAGVGSLPPVRIPLAALGATGEHLPPVDLAELVHAVQASVAAPFRRPDGKSGRGVRRRVARLRGDAGRGGPVAVPGLGAVLPLLHHPSLAVQPSNDGVHPVARCRSLGRLPAGRRAL
jgi:hypothetical protein